MNDSENLNVSDFDIAVVGMDCRFPGAENKDEYWENLKNGVESIETVSDEELLEAGVPESISQKKNYVKAASCMKNFDYFAAEFFGYSKKEAELMDPQQRIFLEICYHAMENAGYDSEQFDGKTGVFAGGTFNSYLIHNILKGRSFDGSAEKFFMQILNDKDNLATRVSYKLNLKGPSLSIQTACSSSLAALHYACQSLISQECDMALAGGVTVRCPQKTGYEYEQDMILSKDGHCRPFDADASGTVFGSGAGVVVLKRLADALEDGDTIHAIVKATGVNNDGADKVGYTAPGSKGQEEVLATVLELSEVDKKSISAIEAHGTATALGDPIEFDSIKKVYGIEEQMHKTAIGSVKGNIGHLECASGIAGLIKMVLCLEHKTLVPSLHFKKPNPHLDLEGTRFYINTETKDWIAEEGEPLRCAISSFGIGGTNAHIILEEGVKQKVNNTEEKQEIFVFSAKTLDEFHDTVENMRHFLTEQKPAALSDIAFTLKHGRRAYEYRYAAAASSLEELTEALAPQKYKPEKVMQNPKVVFAFSGSNAQYEDRIGSLYQNMREFKAVFDEEAQLIWKVCKIDVRSMIDTSDCQKEDREKCFSQFQVSFMVKTVLGKIWMKWGVIPDEVIGDGIGQYVAAYLSGQMDFQDAWEKMGSPSFDEGVYGKTADLHKRAADLRNSGYDVFVEIGFESRITDLANSIKPGVQTIVTLSKDGEEDNAFLYQAAGKLWSIGVEVSWNTIETNTKHRHIELPVYPFCRKRYFIEPGKEKEFVCKESQMDACIGSQPEKETQEKVASAFAQVLALDYVDAKDDFYEMGGHSLLAIQLVNQLNAMFNLELKLNDIAANPTVERITEKIENCKEHY